tara:strand:- start:224 stop:505 length:282 start_codon:yes stop_codon:yes gene_type:complete
MVDRVKITGIDVYTISKIIDLDDFEHRDTILDDRYTEKDIGMMKDIIDNEIYYLGKYFYNKFNIGCGHWEIEELDYTHGDDLKKIPISKEIYK